MIWCFSLMSVKVIHIYRCVNICVSLCALKIDFSFSTVSKQSVAPSWSTGWIIASSSTGQRLTGIFTNTSSISTEERNVVRGVIKCCRGKRERERESVREWGSSHRSESGKVILREGCYIIGGPSCKELQSAKNKEDCLGHDNNLIFRVCNLMISSQNPAAT